MHIRLRRSSFVLFIFEGSKNLLNHENQITICKYHAIDNKVFKSLEGNAKAYCEIGKSHEESLSHNIKGQANKSIG